MLRFVVGGAITSVLGLLAGGAVFWNVITGGSGETPRDEMGVVSLQRSFLNGEVVPMGTEERVIAVMVENHTDSRPMQSGFEEAEVVIETLVEGGITRFMLLFSYNYPERVGPVRSARPYFVLWAREWSAVYMHAGGSREAFTEIYKASKSLINADEGYVGTFRDRKYYAPHNLFANLKETAEKAWEDERWGKVEEPWFGFCVGEEVCERGEERGKAKRVAIQFSYNGSYDVEFEYDVEEGVYKREGAGIKQLDQVTGEQMETKNLIIMQVPYRVIDEEGRLRMEVVGEGEAELFVEGKRYTGAWKKEEKDGRTYFFDPVGKKIWDLSPGKVWIVAVEGEENYTVEEL